MATPLVRKVTIPVEYSALRRFYESYCCLAQLSFISSWRGQFSEPSWLQLFEHNDTDCNVATATSKTVTVEAVSYGTERPFFSESINLARPSRYFLPCSRLCVREYSVACVTALFLMHICHPWRDFLIIRSRASAIPGGGVA